MHTVIGTWCLPKLLALLCLFVAFPPLNISFEKYLSGCTAATLFPSVLCHPSSLLFLQLLPEIKLKTKNQKAALWFPSHKAFAGERLEQSDSKLFLEAQFCSEGLHLGQEYGSPNLAKLQFPRAFAGIADNKEGWEL